MVAFVYSGPGPRRKRGTARGRRRDAGPLRGHRVGRARGVTEALRQGAEKERAEALGVCGLRGSGVTAGGSKVMLPSGDGV